jgi:hypothetical protein
MTATAPPAPTAEIDRLRALTAELLGHDAWSREELLAHQRERLRALLRHAAANSPYYREALGAAAGDPDVDLASLPTLSKEALVERFDDVAPTAACAAQTSMRTSPARTRPSRTWASTACSRRRGRPGCAASSPTTAPTWRSAPRSACGRWRARASARPRGSSRSARRTRCT